MSSCVSGAVKKNVPHLLVEVKTRSAVTLVVSAARILSFCTAFPQSSGQIMEAVATPQELRFRFCEKGVNVASSHLESSTVGPRDLH